MPNSGNRCDRIRSPGKQIKIVFIPAKQWTVTIRRQPTKSDDEAVRYHNFRRAECGGEVGSGVRGLA